MNGNEESAATGFGQMNDLLAWWKLPIANGAGIVQGNLRGAQTLARELQKVLTESFSSEVSATIESNERIRQAFQDMLQFRQPQNVLATEAEILSLFVERSSQQAKRWSETTQKIGECCMAMAHDMAGETRRQAAEHEKSSPKPGKPQSGAAS
jgi:hypothetical protein